MIFEANELGMEIYKEQIASKLPEYSYKTVASIVDEGLKKEYFVKLIEVQKGKVEFQPNSFPSNKLVRICFY